MPPYAKKASFQWDEMNGIPVANPLLPKSVVVFRGKHKNGENP